MPTPGAKTTPTGVTSRMVILVETPRMTLLAARTTAGATPGETVATSAEDGQGPGQLAAPALLLASIHLSAWKGYSAKLGSHYSLEFADSSSSTILSPSIISKVKRTMP